MSISSLSLCGFNDCGCCVVWLLCLRSPGVFLDLMGF